MSKPFCPNSSVTIGLDLFSFGSSRASAMWPSTFTAANTMRLIDELQQAHKRHLKSSFLLIHPSINISSAETVYISKFLHQQIIRTEYRASSAQHHVHSQSKPASKWAIVFQVGSAAAATGTNQDRSTVPNSSDRRYQDRLQRNYEMSRGRRYSRHDSITSRHDEPL